MSERTRLRGSSSTRGEAGWRTRALRFGGESAGSFDIFVRKLNWNERSDDDDDDERGQTDKRTVVRRRVPVNKAANGREQDGPDRTARVIKYRRIRGRKRPRVRRNIRVIPGALSPVSKFLSTSAAGNASFRRRSCGRPADERT